VKRADGTTTALAGTHLLVAAGRKANVDDLGLEAAGVRIEQGRLVHRDLATANPQVHVIGDAAGGHQFTHVAEHHAGIILRRTIFRLRWAKPSAVVPWCTYTDPELARVGLSEAEAKRDGIAHAVYRFGFEDLDRARAERETAGFAKLVADPRGRLLGAAIVGAHAGELIAEAVLAINHGLKLGALSAAIHAYPTLAQVNRRAADQRLKAALTPTAKSWLRRLAGLKGT
jgi:pyruvate/2-oxoglutarate dehydrogenase complex dihydrolipoamide dehydrogenase (E3) component